jgi:hypothetical protein
MSRRPPTGAVLLAIVVAASLLWGAGTAQACGGTETAKATKKVNPGGRAPLAIGDSTMLLALPDLARVGYQANARGCRTIEEGLDVIREYKRQGRLPHLVVIALGADATLSSGQMETAFRLVGRKRVLGLVTPIELGGGTSNDADVVRAAVKRHEKRGVLLDWVHFSSGHPEYFQPDGLHLTFPGADAFARLLRKALRYARPGEFRGRPPTGKSGLDKTRDPVR